MALPLVFLVCSGAKSRKVPLGLQREFCAEFRRKAKQAFGGPACDTLLPDGWTFPGELFLGNFGKK